MPAKHIAVDPHNLSESRSYLMLHYVKNAKVKKTDLASIAQTAAVTGEGLNSEPVTVFSDELLAH